MSENAGGSLRCSVEENDRQQVRHAEGQDFLQTRLPLVFLVEQPIQVLKQELFDNGSICSIVRLRF